METAESGSHGAAGKARFNWPTRRGVGKILMAAVLYRSTKVLIANSRHNP